MVNSHEAWCIMAATVTLSIRPERTDARVGLHAFGAPAGHRLAKGVGLRSKLQLERG